MNTIPFSVDAALLRELGERLVGKPYIALAELIKNSYDADATQVLIDLGRDTIKIRDNGHGMTFGDFQSFWMRIGSPHKQAKQTSRSFGRPLTGSKGVGRLAVQFLAHKLEMVTVSAGNPDMELFAEVDWDQAVVAGELTKAQAYYEERMRRPETLIGYDHGSEFVLTGLKQTWEGKSYEDLAREVWTLQPPFLSSTQAPDSEYEKRQAFKVTLESSDRAEVESFDNQMTAFLGLYHARLIGRLVNVENDAGAAVREIDLIVEFPRWEKLKISYPVPESCPQGLQFEIRVYYVNHKQAHGVKVDDLREYLKGFGGVHVYDAGFHLPYYGIESDWLGVETAHSHRLITSQLLPAELQEKGGQGIRFLPTNNRLFGVVNVNTSRERTIRASLEGARRDHLAISVTRDRLVNNNAYESLRDTVRWALDYYAVQEARRNAEQKRLDDAVEPIPRQFRQVEQVLERYKDELPESAYQELQERFQEAVQARTAEAEAMSGRVGLLGALATAGISALSYEHEVGKQFQLVEGIAGDLKRLRTSDRAVNERLSDLASQLEHCVSRARATRALFSFLMDEDNRTLRERFKARNLIGQVTEQMGVLLRGVDVDRNEVSASLRLPEAGYAEWSAIFQNVLLNAVNAMLDVKNRQIVIRSSSEGKNHAIFIEDTGKGVELSSSEDLFKPFVRKLSTSPDRQALGLGGTGLGLAIVRMIATAIHCEARFVKPDPGFKTAFKLSWSETS